MKLIIAKNNLGFIGLNGGLPWKCKEDLLHFKKLTWGCKLLVGRVTYESLPKLPNRELIVVGSGYNTLESALSMKPDWVIGGKMVYEATYQYCDEIHMSIIGDNTVGDTLSSDFKNFNGDIIKYYFKPH